MDGAMNKQQDDKSAPSLIERAASKMASPISPRDYAPLSPSALEKTVRTPVSPKKEIAQPDNKSRPSDINMDILRARGFVTPDTPATATAEEFRIIKRQLLRQVQVNRQEHVSNPNLILVSSSHPDEGKSFCAVNLALSMVSERDLTVLLVDADFSKPEILTSLGLKGGKGLMDVLSEPDLDIAQCLIRTNIENLSILPAGRQHNHSTEHLASDRMKQVMQEMSQRYRDRIIIFDSPPALASSAASVLATHVGQIIFVVEADKTRESDLQEALSLMSACPNIQLVLNKVPVHQQSRRFAHYYGYGG